MWGIAAEQDGACVARMEQVLEVYARPDEARLPVVCMDEPPFPLLSERRRPVSLGGRRGRLVDDEDVREGSGTVWMFVAPLGGWREVRVTPRRTAVEWAEQGRAWVDAPRDAEAEGLVLVCDHLNPHDVGSLSTAFEPSEATRLMDRLEWVYTPKHGSWLNVAELELSVLTRQSLSERLGSEEAVAERARPWAQERNRKQIGVDWPFTTQDARTKLKRLYPNIKT